MPASKLDTLIRRITDTFRRYAADYGLDAQSVEARYILNMGGFVNASFFIRDGQRTLHLKLADDEDQQDSLRRWFNLRDTLAERYRAPRVLDWVKIPRTPYAGLLSEYIPGRPARLDQQPAVLSGVLEMLARLHADASLAAALRAMDEQPEAPTCAEYFISVYIDRFDEDLITVADELPPFVSLDLLTWMMGETRELEGLARDLPAFEDAAAAPTHGDLWASNILVTATGDWRVIDWDDLAPGDPALDYSILLGPLWVSGQLSKEELFAMLPAGVDAETAASFRTRFEVCLRAFVLDQVIDPLADWVECSFSPQDQADVQSAKEQTHRAALALYRQIWG